MDVTPYPLVPLTPVPPTPVSVIPIVIDVDPHSAPNQAELLDLFRKAFGKLVILFFFALLLIRRLRQQRGELRAQVGYWQAMHQRAVLRADKLAQEVQLLQAEIRDWKKRTFGRKSETANAAQPENPNSPPPEKPTPRPRGQQANTKGHGRRNHEHLPAIHEVCDLPDDQKCCPDCQKPFAEIPGTSDGAILEIDVKAHRRVYHRKRYRRL